MRARAKAVLALGVLAAIVSCRQVVDIADRDPPLQCSASAFVSNAQCGECLGNRCCTELAACNADALCSSRLGCVAACADDACRSQCEKSSRLNGAYAALAACQASSCDVMCGLACGGAGIPITGCLPCASACCGAGKAFRGDLRGQSLRECRAACAGGDFGCSETCSNTHPEGAHLERAARECVARACGGAGDWSCIGSVEPHKNPGRTSFVIRVKITDGLTRQPVSGVTTKACLFSDVDCAAPIATGMTAALGVATLTIGLTAQTGVDAFAGFLELRGPDHLPHLVYFVPPVSDDATAQVELLSPSAVNQIASAAAIALAPARGILSILALDCAREPRAGVSFAVDNADADSRAFYVRSGSAGGGTYDFHATSTSDAAFGGFFNLRAGTVNVKTRVDHLCANASLTSLAIRGGTVTVVALPPTYNP